MARAGLVLLAATVAGVLAMGAGATAAATPAWHTVPGNTIDHRAFAWLAGRAWVVEGPPGGGKVVVRSARVAGTKLTGWTSRRLAVADRWGWVGELDNDLVWSTGEKTPEGADLLRATRLMPNGTVGRPAEVRTGPATKYSNDSTLAAGRLGDRLLQFTDGKPNTEISELGLCCNVDGGIVDYSSLARPGGLPRAYLGLDRRGRLWLAWNNTVGRERFTAGIVQLDRTTLLPRGQPTKVPSLRYAQVVSLVCFDVCRLVVRGSLPARSSKARNFTWAPGERSPTALFTRGQFGSVIAARDYGGRLVVAYSATDPKNNLLVALARGDARGRNLRDLSSILIPQTLGTFGSGLNLTVGPIGVFGPKGFMAVTKYEGGRKYDVRIAILPL